MAGAGQDLKPPAAGLTGDFASGGLRAITLKNPTLACGKKVLAPIGADGDSKGALLVCRRTTIEEPFFRSLFPLLTVITLVVRNINNNCSCFVVGARVHDDRQKVYIACWRAVYFTGRMGFSRPYQTEGDRHDRHG